MSPAPRARATKKQHELLTFIDGFIREYGYGPSYREIMQALDYKSVSTVATHVSGLIGKGYLEKTDASARSLKPASSPAPEPDHLAWLETALRKKYQAAEKTSNTEEMSALERVAKLFSLEQLSSK